MAQSVHGTTTDECRVMSAGGQLVVSVARTWALHNELELLIIHMLTETAPLLVL